MHILTTIRDVVKAIIEWLCICPGSYGYRGLISFQKVGQSNPTFQPSIGLDWNTFWFGAI